MNREIDRARIAWAQAGIDIEMVGPIIHENPPIDPATTQSILHDNWFDTDDAAGLDAKIVAEAIGAAATPDVLEVVFTGAIRNVNAPADLKYAATSIPCVHDPTDPLAENTYSYIGIRRGVAQGTAVEASARSLGHETGHALTNRLDTIPLADYINFPQVNIRMDTAINMIRRITHSIESEARTARTKGQLGAFGNRLLTP